MTTRHDHAECIACRIVAEIDAARRADLGGEYANDLRTTTRVQVYRWVALVARRECPAYQNGWEVDA